jgi:hypothetical protein
VKVGREDSEADPRLVGRQREWDAQRKPLQGGNMSQDEARIDEEQDVEGHRHGNKMLKNDEAPTEDHRREDDDDDFEAHRHTNKLV